MSIDRLANVPVPLHALIKEFNKNLELDIDKVIQMKNLRIKLQLR